MARPDNLIPQANDTIAPPMPQTGMGVDYLGNLSPNQNTRNIKCIKCFTQGGSSFTPTSLGGILGEAINQGVGAFNHWERRGEQSTSCWWIIDRCIDPSNPKVVFEGKKKPRT